jgi:hypothetical protein
MMGILADAGTNGVAPLPVRYPLGFEGKLPQLLLTAQLAITPPAFGATTLTPVGSAKLPRLYP